MSGFPKTAPPGTYLDVPTSGTLAARPGVTVKGQSYLATDTAGGTLYVSLDGSTWAQVAAGVSSGGSSPIQSVSRVVGSGAPVGFSLPGVDLGGGVGTSQESGNRALYLPIYVLGSPTIDQWGLEVTTGSGTVRAALYNADGDYQPTTLVAGTDSGDISATTTGVKTATLSSPVQLSPGRYVIWVNCSTGPVLRSVRGGQNLLGIISTIGNGPFPGQLFVAQTYGAPPGTPTPWTTLSGSTTSGLDYVVFPRISTP